MKIQTIKLSWFRGAAKSLTLDTTGKSLVVYGPNGSGKSSFADSIEYIINKGKIKHLGHEYSGRKQERGVRNTHTPSGENSTININWGGGKEISVDISPDGNPKFHSAPNELVDEICSWKLENILLRQDEIAAFVCSTKADKYSALLPLLGLQMFEQALETIENLGKQIIKTSELAIKESKLEDLEKELKTHFKEINEIEIFKEIEDIGKKYKIGASGKNYVELGSAISKAINNQLKTLEPEQKRFVLLKQIIDETISSKILLFKKLNGEMKRGMETLVDRRIAVLEKTSEFITEISKDKKTIECPACGQKINCEEFRNHVDSELKEMHKLSVLRKNATKASRILIQSIAQFNNFLKDDCLNEFSIAPLNEEIIKFKTIDSEKECWTEDEILNVERAMKVIDAYIQESLKKTPQPLDVILKDRDRIDASLKLPIIKEIQMYIQSLKIILETLDNCKNNITETITERTKETIKLISKDIQFLWSKMHPDEPIEDVHLYLPDETDHVIDIGLKFYGIDQSSPRITLSEGHRNSIGLCIFFALSRLDAATIRPIVLDDIVSSLDREHRGMLVDILMDEFKDRQVLLFTHDREWFKELRVRLDDKIWGFKAIRTWKNPEYGIQWQDWEPGSFNEAKSLVENDPEAAGNRVRAIMDWKAAYIAEKIKIRLPFLRGERNDYRTSIQIMPHIISKIASNMKKNINGKNEPYAAPKSDWETALKLLEAWSDRSSHTGTMVKNEVTKMSDKCEKAISTLKCASCNTDVWFAEAATKEWIQCKCGELVWKYNN